LRREGGGGRTHHEGVDEDVVVLEGVEGGGCGDAVLAALAELEPRHHGGERAEHQVVEHLHLRRPGEGSGSGRGWGWRGFGAALRLGSPRWAEIYTRVSRGIRVRALLGSVRCGAARVGKFWLGEWSGAGRSEPERECARAEPLAGSHSGAGGAACSRGVELLTKELFQVVL
jgi:hypothetical protein